MSFGSQFLHYPGLFPARIAGECWGECGVTVQLAGAAYRITGLNGAQAEAVATRFGALCLPAVPPAATDTELRVFRAEAEDFLGVPYAGWDYSLDCAYQPHAVRIAGLRLMARLEHRPSPCMALWTPAADAALVADGSLENVLRVLVAHRLLASGGVLLHSACVVRNGQAYLFFGHSGAGKSTLSRLSLAAGFTVLSDDMNALILREGQVWVEKLPFAGDLGQDAVDAGCYPLRAAYRLAKAPVHAVQLISHATAASALLACAPYANQDPYALDSLLAWITQIIERIAVKRLEFALDTGFWRILPE